jgi:hypothetical protein
MRQTWCRSQAFPVVSAVNKGPIPVNQLIQKGHHVCPQKGETARETLVHGYHQLDITNRLPCTEISTAALSTLTPISLNSEDGRGDR